MIASKDKFHFWVGMTIVIVIAIFIGLLCTVFTPNYFRPKTVVETYFTESVNGLSPGAPVKFKGIDIGKVTDISLSSKVYPEHHIGLFSPDSSVAVVRMIVYLDEDQLKNSFPPSSKTDYGFKRNWQASRELFILRRIFKSHALSSRN